MGNFLPTPGMTETNKHSSIATKSENRASKAMVDRLADRIIDLFWNDRFIDLCTHRH